MSLSSIVIKVKYGETLRRISPAVHDKKLFFDFFMLKEKIRGLLGFAPGAVFNMTYEDEDGDIVTLATDDDIHDVMQQSLDPLRITVKLSNNNHLGGSSGAASAPMKFPQNSYQQHPQNVFQPQPQNSFHQKQQRLQLQQQLFQCQQRQQQLQSQLQTLNSGVPLEPLPQPQFQTMNAPFNRVYGGSANSSGSTNSF